MLGMKTVTSYMFTCEVEERLEAWELGSQGWNPSYTAGWLSALTDEYNHPDALFP